LGERTRKNIIHGGSEKLNAELDEPGKKTPDHQSHERRQRNFSRSVGTVLQIPALHPSPFSKSASRLRDGAE